MSDFIPLAVVALVIFFVNWFYSSRSQSIIQNWANQNGFQLLRYQQKFFRTGPFRWWTIGRGQTIYTVIVRTPDGRDRSGWIRCGSFWSGVYFSNDTEVRWETE